MKRTFKFLFWLGVAAFLSGAAFQVAGRLTALEVQSELDRQPDGETIPAWVGKSYGEDMVFAGAIFATAGGFGLIWASRRRRRETDIDDFNGDAPLDLFDRLEKETAYIVGRGISDP